MSQESIKPVLIVVVGPTGIGKTSLAIRLAQALNGEIISADSRQVYRYMDIGTAKPTQEERTQAQHHLVEIIDPDEDFGLATYQELALAAIEQVVAQNKLPLLVGGTGQYVKAVVEGWKIPKVPPDIKLRKSLAAQGEAEGNHVLYERLLSLDPDAESLIDARNVRRVIRALEVCIKSGRPFSEQRGKTPLPYTIHQIGLNTERLKLYEHIDARVDAMIEHGLVQEVHDLLARGYDWTLPAMSSLGYIQLQDYVEGTATLDEGVALIKKETRRFIRHQFSWFRPASPDITWLEATSQPEEEAIALAKSWLQV